MDYKYIEQLIERYWNCETSLEEEHILHTFFYQGEVPIHLLRFKALFAYEEEEKKQGLGRDFDEKLLTLIESSTVKARRWTLRTRLMPLLRAAAAIIVIVSIGIVIEHSMNKVNKEMIYNHTEYKNVSDDQGVACQVVPMDTVKKMAVEESVVNKEE